MSEHFLMQPWFWLVAGSGWAASFLVQGSGFLRGFCAGAAWGHFTAAVAVWLFRA